MVVVHAFIEVKEGAAKDFLAVAEKCVTETRKEPGCQFYNLYSDTENAREFVFVEEWESQADLDEHTKLPHFLELVESVTDLLAVPLDIKVFEAKKL